MTGHLLGAAGAVETISLFFLKYGIVPTTINHFTDDENIDSKLNLLLIKLKKRDMNVVMSNTLVWRP
jgi:3-oxoacyl-[acyl-carrier-protein] synthase II